MDNEKGLRTIHDSIRILLQEYCDNWGLTVHDIRCDWIDTSHQNKPKMILKEIKMDISSLGGNHD